MCPPYHIAEEGGGGARRVSKFKKFRQPYVAAPYGGTFREGSIRGTSREGTPLTMEVGARRNRAKPVWRPPPSRPTSLSGAAASFVLNTKLFQFMSAPFVTHSNRGPPVADFPRCRRTSGTYHGTRALPLPIESANAKTALVPSPSARAPRRPNVHYVL